MTRDSLRPRAPGNRDRGNAVVEAAVLAPVLILFLAGLLVAARVRHATAAVSHAAADAARQASISRSQAEARTTATASVLSTLRQRGLHCQPQISLDLSGFNRPVGQAAMVTASVRCTVRLSDVALPGIPGSRTVTGHHRSPIDPFRGR